MAKYSLSKAREFISGFEEHRFHVGIDVHKRSYHLALRRADGQTLSWVSPASPLVAARSLLQLGVEVGAAAYEAGPTGFALYRKLTEYGYRVIVAAPSRIPRPSTRGAKTDRLDCIRLAEYAAKGILQPIAVPSETEEARRTLVRRRHQLADNLRKVKTRIKALLWTRRSIKALGQLDLEKSAVGLWTACCWSFQVLRTTWAN